MWLKARIPALNTTELTLFPDYYKIAGNPASVRVKYQGRSINIGRVSISDWIQQFIGYNFTGLQLHCHELT